MKTKNPYQTPKQKRLIQLRHMASTLWKMLEEKFCEEKKVEKIEGIRVVESFNDWYEKSPSSTAIKTARDLIYREIYALEKSRL